MKSKDLFFFIPPWSFSTSARSTLSFLVFYSLQKVKTVQLDSFNYNQELCFTCFLLLHIKTFSGIFHELSARCTVTAAESSSVFWEMLSISMAPPVRENWKLRLKLARSFHKTWYVDNYHCMKLLQTIHRYLLQTISELCCNELVASVPITNHLAALFQMFRRSVLNSENM